MCLCSQRQGQWWSKDGQAVCLGGPPDSARGNGHQPLSAGLPGKSTGDHSHHPGGKKLHRFVLIFMDPVLRLIQQHHLVCLGFMVNSFVRQLWLPRRRTWVSLIRWSSWRNPPPPWCPLPHRPTPPSLWMLSSTSESRYHQPDCNSYKLLSLEHFH